MLDAVAYPFGRCLRLKAALARALGAFLIAALLAGQVAAQTGLTPSELQAAYCVGVLNQQISMIQRGIALPRMAESRKQLLQMTLPFLRSLEGTGKFLGYLASTGALFDPRRRRAEPFD